MPDPAPKPPLPESDFYAEFRGPAPADVAAPGDDFYAEFRSATPKAVTATRDDPEKAGKSIELSNKLQKSPTVIYHDFDNSVWEGKAKTASAIVDPSPYMQNYINNVPLAASVSSDDWGPLSRNSTALLNLFPDEQQKRAEGAAILRIPEVESTVQTAAGRRQFLDIVTDKTIPANLRREYLLGSSYKYSALDVAMSKVSELYGRGIEAVTGIPAEEAEKSLMALGGGLKVPAKFGPSTAAEVEAFLNRARGMQSRSEIDEFLRRRAAGDAWDDATGTWSTDPAKGQEAQNVLKIERADTAARDLKDAVDTAAETKTRERSPTVFEQFVDSHGDAGTVHIPAGKILEMYEAEKKIPLPGDGLFGFIPNLADKATLAAETGGEISVPISRYIANIDPAVHDQIADVVRVHADGTTREEAKDLGKAEEPTEPAQVSADANVQAAAESVEREAKSLGITSPKELFTDKFVEDAQTLGVTKKELSDFANLIDRRQEMILEKAVAAATGEVKKRQTVQWETDKNEMAQQVTAELQARPDIAADRYFRTGDLPDGQRMAKVKLNKEEVEAIAGEGALSRYVTDDEGTNSDFIANTLGFRSGPELIRALDALDKERKAAELGPKAHFDSLVKTETAKRMEQKFGDLKTNIAVEASNAALQDYNVDLLSAQWKMLAKMAGVEPPVARANLTKWAGEQFSQAEVGQVGYETFRRAAEKAGNQVRKNLLAGKYADAFKAQQTHMLNFVLARQAKDFEKTIVRPTQRLIDRYAGDVTFRNVDQAFTDAIHGLLYNYGVQLVRTKQNIDYNLQGQTYSDFIDKRNANGALLPKPALPTPGPNVSLDSFTVNQYTDFASLLKSLDYNGKREKSIEIAGKRENRFQVVDKTLKNLDALEKEGFDPEGKVEGVVSGLRKAGRIVDSKLLKVETLVDRIDHRDPLGPLNQTINRPLIEGQQNIGFTMDKLARMIRENNPTDKAWGRKLNERADNQELYDWETGDLQKVTNEKKIAIALNYGNLGNRKVMLEGEHWNEKQVEAFLKRTMSPMDWAAVNFLHSLFKPLGPLVEATTKARSGLAVPMVEPEPFLSSGGGYYPLIQNPHDVLIGAKVKTDLFDKTTFDPLPMAPALKQRTGAVYRLDYSLNRLNSIIAQTVFAVHMQQPVINANKIIKDPLVREGIARAFGPEYVSMLDDYIKDIANNGGQNNDFWPSWISRNLRENVVTALMGWKVSTALIHGGSAGAASLYEIGKMHLEEKGAKSFVLAPWELVQNIKALGLQQFLPESTRRMLANDENFVSNFQEIMNESRELPNRQRALQKDFGYQLDKIFSKNILDDAARARAVFQTYAMSMVAYLDLLTATPVYLAARDKALMEGHERPDAIYIADKAVREAHGSASLVSRANIGRGEINKWLTIAYNGYWNHNYNKSREMVNILMGRSGGEPPQLPPPGFSGAEAGADDPNPCFTAGMKLAMGAAFMTAFVVASGLIHWSLRGKEEEDPTMAGLGMLASQLGGQVPMVNTLMYALIHNRDPQITPLENVFKSGADVLKDAKKAAAGDDPKHPVAHTARALSFLGFPMTNQIIDWVTFAANVMAQEEDPEGVGDWFRGLTMTEAQRKEHQRHQ